MAFLGIAGWILAIGAIHLVVFLIYINVRAQRLNRTVGSFSSALQIGAEGKWYAGVGQYGASSLLWYKLVGLNFSPFISLPRYDLELSASRPHGDSVDMVEVTITYQEQSWDMAMDTLTYNGLVSWVESSAPHPTQF